MNFFDKEEFQRVLGDYRTTSSRKLSTDGFGSKITATVVILMGMSKLDEIVAYFKMNPKEKCP
jgi:uroporphyrin-III C-methyltransferase